MKNENDLQKIILGYSYKFFNFVESEIAIFI